MVGKKMYQRPEIALVVVLVLLAVGMAQGGKRKSEEIEDDTLKLVVIIHRHGDRTPIYVPEQYKDLWPQGDGQLTGLGVHQLWELGELIRGKLSTNFLSANYSPGIVYSRAANKDRTLQSAVSMMMALFPPGTGPMFPFEAEASDENPSLPYDFQPIPTHSVALELDYVMRALQNCPTYKSYLEEVVYESDEAKQLEEEYISTLQALNDAFDEEVVLMNLSTYYDYLFCSDTHGMQTLVTEEVFEETVELYNKAYSLEFAPSGLSRLIGGPLMGQVLDDLQDYATGVNTKLKAKVYSGHDVTLGSLLSFMGLEQSEAPPYASWAMFELHRIDAEWKVKFSYNGEALDLDFCSMSGDYCTLQEYEDVFRADIPADPAGECGAEDASPQPGVPSSSGSPFFSLDLVISVLVVTVLLLLATVAVLLAYVYHLRLRAHAAPFAQLGGSNTEMLDGEEPTAIELDEVGYTVKHLRKVTKSS